MKTLKTTRQEAVERKEAKNVSDLLIFLGELTPEEASQLLNSGDEKVREYAIKYADRKNKIERLLVEHDSSIAKCIFNSIGELTPEEANWLLNAEEGIVRTYAIKFADKKSKISKLLLEEDELVAYHILENLEVELTAEEKKQFLNAVSDDVRIYALEFADRKSCVDRLLIEENKVVIEYLLEKLGILKNDEANLLLKARHREVSTSAAKFADRKSIVEQLLVEKDYYVVTNLLSCLGQLTSEEANLLLNARFKDTIEFVARFADRKNIVEQLLVEEDDVVVIGLLKCLDKLTVKEANLLLKASQRKVRTSVAKFADRKSIVEQLLVEKEELVTNSLLNCLGKLTTDEENQILQTQNSYVREYFKKRKEVISHLLAEENAGYAQKLLWSLEKLTTEEANLLLNAKVGNVIKFAARFADRKSIVDRILVEENEYVVEALLSCLGKLTTEETIQLLKVKSRYTREKVMLSINYEKLLLLRGEIIDALQNL